MNIQTLLTHGFLAVFGCSLWGCRATGQVDGLQQGSDKAQRLLFGGGAAQESGSKTSERFTGNVSATYEQAIAHYAALAEKHPFCALHEVGRTDAGTPLHVFVLDGSGQTDLVPTPDRVTLLVNNGIHPGEPCGIDASMKLAETLTANTKAAMEVRRSMRLAIIPVYNVGGALNRGCCSRANQNGPQEYGFRGNAKNLDLNRDFIKSDSHNAAAFQTLFTALQPDLFLDTHTSNGADYQYTMTMITTQPDKASEALTSYLRDVVNPAVFANMKARGWEMTPYVHTMGQTPFQGIKDFLETPRFSTGYAALFNCIGFTSETHMFKPFADRVESTYQFELALCDFAVNNGQELLEVRQRAQQSAKEQKGYALQWELDTTQYRELAFRGYEPLNYTSELTGQPRLKYNRENPQTKTIRYYDHHQASVEVEAPQAYIIPQAWTRVIEILRRNGVQMRTLDADAAMLVESYTIADYDSRSTPYEGHYLHTNVQVVKLKEEVPFRAGDVYIEVNQACNRFIVETLEPQGVDSFFAWNFFDSTLQQKEWFSSYVFEDKAAEMLANDPQLKERFEQAVAADPDMQESGFQQLYWLYQRSDYFEPTVNRYPVYRVPANP